MAKRRKKSHRSSRRRHRMGAIGGSMVTNALGLVAGAVASRLVVKKVAAKMDPKLTNAGTMVLGILLPRFMKSELGKSIGAGMVAAGGLGLASQFLPAIAGVSGDSIELPVTVGEVQDNLSLIAGDNSVLAGDNLSVLAGMDEDNSGVYF